MFFKFKKKTSELETRLKLMEEALRYWVSYNEEFGDKHPCPDYKLRIFYRQKAEELSKKLGIKRF